MSIEPPISWKRNLAVIWFTQLVAIVGFTVVMPLLPLYVSDLGVEDERQIRIWAGAIYSGQAVAMAIFGPIWGALSDRFGRKVMVERAMFGGAVVIALMGRVQTVQQLVLLRVVQGALTGTLTATDALVATTTPRERAGSALGLLQMAVYLGASVGPLVGGLVADSFGYRMAFFVTGALLFLAGLGVLFFVREEFEPVTTPAGQEAAAGGERPGLRHRLWIRLAPVLGSGALLSVIGVRLLMRLGARLTSPVLPLFIQSILPPDARVASTAGVISGVSAGVGAVGALGLGRLGDRTGYRPVMIACAMTAGVSYFLQFFVSGPDMLLVLQAVSGLAMGGILSTVSAALARLSPEGQQGIVYGVSASIVSLANAVGPMVGSTLAAWVGLRVPFLVAASIYGLAGAAAARLIPRRSSLASRKGVK